MVVGGQRNKLEVEEVVDEGWLPKGVGGEEVRRAER